MSARAYPPGPTFMSEWKRPFKEVAAETSQGLLVHVRSRFDRYGDMFCIANKTPTYVTKSPDHLYEVLVTRASSFMKRARDLDTFLGQGLLTSDGALWRKQRRLIQPAFSHANIKRYAQVMVDLTQATVDGWKSGEERDLNREMMELTLRVVSKSLLDYDGANINDAVAHAMAVLQSTAGYDVFPTWMPNPVRAHKKRATKPLDELIFSIIDQRLAKPGDDLVSQLLAGTDGGEGMEKQQLRDELVTLFLAGHETTALAMTWTFFLLSSGAAEEAKLHQELDRVLGKRAPSYADLESLVYTKNVVQEAMRIFPPLYLLPRVAKEPTEIGGYQVDAGAEVLLWVYFMHHDPRWFPRPSEFRPDRFLPNSGEYNHPQAFLPFGAGPRACIGSRFAMMEAVLLLAAIAQRFRIRLTPGQNVRLNPRVTMGPSAPIMVRLEAR